MQPGLDEQLAQRGAWGSGPSAVFRAGCKRGLRSGVSVWTLANVCRWLSSQCHHSLTQVPAGQAWGRLGYCSHGPLGEESELDTVHCFHILRLPRHCICQHGTPLGAGQREAPRADCVLHLLVALERADVSKACLVPARRKQTGWGRETAFSWA